MSLVVLSGWGTTAATLQGLEQQLGGTRSLKVCSVHDLRRDPTDATASWPGCSEYAQGLLSLLAEQHEASHVVGWSMGGTVALEAAAHDPGRIASFVFLSTTARFCSDPTYPHGPPAAELRAFKQACLNRPEDLLNSFFELVAAPYQQDNAIIEEQVARALSIGPPELANGLDYLMAADVRRHTAALEIPCAIIHGDADAVIPVAAGHWLSEHLGKCAFNSIPGAGHDLPTREPAFIADYIRRFIGEAGRAP